MSTAANPNAPTGAPKVEKAGTVTSDSLAGESLSSGGDFGSKSHAAASKQPSSSTNTNNTDTSGATTLAPAADASSRLDAEEGTEQSKTGSSGSSRSGGSKTILTASGGTLGGSDADPPASGKPYNTTTGSGSNIGTAPSAHSSTNTSQQPKGKDISEGGFDSSAPNASFNGDVGGKNDPSRVALQDMQKKDSQAGADNSGPRQVEVTNDGQFDSLGETSA